MSLAALRHTDALRHSQITMLIQWEFQTLFLHVRFWLSCATRFVFVGLCECVFVFKQEWITCKGYVRFVLCSSKRGPCTQGMYGTCVYSSKRGSCGHANRDQAYAHSSSTALGVAAPGQLKGSPQTKRCRQSHCATLRRQQYAHLQACT